MATTLNVVTLDGIIDDTLDTTWYISGTVTKADEGKALSIDTTTARTLKLSADGDAVIGRAMVIEKRTQEGVRLVTLGPKGSAIFTYTGTAPTLAQQIQGSATPGVVKLLNGANARFPHVITSVDTTALTVSVLFL